MINLFPNLIKKVRSQKPSHSIAIERSDSDIVEEIHETFFTEVDRLMQESRIINSVSGEKMSLVEKMEVLNRNGFHSTTIKNVRKDTVRLDSLASENKIKIATVEAIRYFSFKYPQYKFITEDSIKKICEKYGLIYSVPDHYIGFIPEKNVIDIANFKIDPSDECFYVHPFYGYLFKADGYCNKIQFDEFKQKVKSGEINNGDKDSMYYGEDYISSLHSNVISKEPMMIAAPIRDFNTTFMKVENFKLVSNIKDPIIFKPVQFEGYKFYLIVTAWGLEASDPIVVNERMN